MTLSEQIKMTHQTILIPTSLKYVGAPYESAVKEIVALVDDSNDEQTDVVHKCDLITNALRKSLSLMDEVVQQGMKQNYDHHLSLKKKDFIIQGLKSFNDFQKKTAVTKKPAINKTDGLSDAERKVLKSLSK
jgi:hypothetical protein